MTPAKRSTEGAHRKKLLRVMVQPFWVAPLNEKDLDYMVRSRWARRPGSRMLRRDIWFFRSTRRIRKILRSVAL